MKKILLELQTVFALSPSPSTIHPMFLNLLATCAPLIVGVMFGSLVPAIIAALLGHFLFLTNAPTRLYQRLKNCIKNTFFFLACLVVGTLLKQMPYLFPVVFCLGVYALGISINISVRAELVMLLGLVNLIVGFYSSFIDSKALLQIGEYSFFCLIFCMVLFTIFHLTFEDSGNISRTPKPDLRSTMKEFHIYSLTFSLVALIGFILCEYGISERPYWVLITFIVIYKPEIKISLYKMLQRLLGTLLGVAIASLFFHYVHQIHWHFTFIALSSFLLPYGVARNYWLGTILITTLVVSLLSLPTKGGDAEHLALIRMTATFWGIGLALVGILTYRWIQKIPKLKSTQ